MLLEALFGVPRLVVLPSGRFSNGEFMMRVLCGVWGTRLGGASVGVLVAGVRSAKALS